MRLSRRSFLSGTAALLATPSVAKPRAARNVVFIIIDDLLSVSFHRRKFGVSIQTPNLNRLMKQGAYFSNAFASTAMCSPSRAAILSGKNAFKNGVHQNSHVWDFDLWATFPGRLAANNYHCFMYGKVVHAVGSPPENWVSLGICEEAIGPGPDNPHQLSTEDPAVCDMAIARLQSLRGMQPWLLMVGLGGPHVPHGEIPEFLDLYPQEAIIPQDWSGEPPSCIPARQRGWMDEFSQMEASGQVPAYIQAYLADVTAMDEQLGRFLDALDLYAPSALVVLTSDHGYALGAHDIHGKFTLWDEAGRAPLVVRHPSYPNAGVNIPQTVSLLDIGPTIFRHAGLTVPTEWDGEPLQPYIRNLSLNRTSGTLMTMTESVSFRNNRYRISRYTCGAIELYDQLNDPDSTVNLAFKPGYETLTNTLLAKLDNRVTAWKGKPQGE